MKKLFVIFLFLISFQLFSAPISKNVAYKIAEYYLKLIDKSGEKVFVSEAYIPKWLGINDELYIFESNNAYVIIAGDDAVIPILAYSDEGIFSNKDSLCPGVAIFLSQYKTQIINIRQNGLTATQEIKSQWDALLNKNYKIRSQVGPLLYAKWNQDCNYNALCPPDPNGPCGHVYAGCVATAMAMNMYYYRHPINPTGNAFYYAPGYGALAVNFNQQTYDFNKMPSEIKDSSYEIAKLIYHCGVAVNMGYSPNGSGAQVYNAAEKMKNNFGYNPNLSFKYRDDYSDNQWITMLQNQLDQKIILQYAAYDENSGHAFICDGYSDNDYFHFNWGWSGYYNGFYYINNLNPGYNFNYYHQAIFDCYPTSTSYSCSNHVLTSHSGSITTSAPHLSEYGNNWSCSWLIDVPDTLSRITLTFRYFSTMPGDTLYIYNGNDESGQILNKFSGDNVPSSIDIYNTPIFIKFISDNVDTDKGFLIDYNAVPATFCKILTTYNNPNDIILSDGSGSYNYRPNTNCRWFINNSNASVYNFNPTLFDLSFGDTLKIFERINGSDVLLYNFHKYNQAHSFSSSASRIIFYFITDESYQGEGFEFIVSKQTSITNYEDYDNLKYSIIDNNLFIWIDSDENNQLSLYNLSGQEIYNISTTSNNEKPIIIPFNYSSGVYILKQQNNLKTNLYKIIKF
jgi:hypothetical protein